MGTDTVKYIAEIRKRVDLTQSARRIEPGREPIVPRPLDPTGDVERDGEDLGSQDSGEIKGE